MSALIAFMIGADIAMLIYDIGAIIVMIFGEDL